MKTPKSDYYREELKKVTGGDTTSGRELKIRCDIGETVYIPMNKESATEIIRYLMEQYKVDVPKCT